ncbi:MAG: arsenite methyltransferase [Thaumarchaeota archaeon]|nr:arsenite methyltransferase [Nitrososphaerota archaeon]
MSEQIKKEIKQRYSKIAVSGNSDCCCMPGECGGTDSPMDAAKVLGYDTQDLMAIPQSSILGVGCGAPLNFANLREGETVVDLGSGAGIDAFLSANKVSKTGTVIGIDMTDEMLDKARKNASEGNYTNVHFKKGDIEENIPVDDNSVDAVISNCVINLTTNKTSAFKEVYRILKNGGRMVISDLITDREIKATDADLEQWCKCIDGALTKENYIQCMRDAGFEDVSVMQEKTYMEGEEIGGRKITSLIIRAIK